MPDTPQMKPWIEAIHAYTPGRSTGAGGRPLVKLSANENPLGCSPDALTALRDADNLARYPDPDATALREAIGAKHRIAPARIACGAGSGEMLQCAVQAFAGPGDEMLFAEYSFSLYPLLAMKVGAKPVGAPMNDYVVSVDALLAAATERTRVVLLDNPNNPCGSWIDFREVKRLHDNLPRDVLLVVDQAYAEYLGVGLDDGALDLAAEHGNVLVTRTFSKAYGLAAERIGWATGAPELVGAINKLRGAFNVSATGQRAALAGLADEQFLSHSQTENAGARTAFTAAIDALGNHGIRAVPSEANFVLVLFEGELSADAAMSAIEAGGYAVRHLPGQGLPYALRITIGTRAQMDEIAEILRQAAQATA
ncbi:aminotransferase class I/II-fold pyridoxal phosphate-dependent enzyme [Erythrobacter litoralis]|uniref:pyridoxal phosphate-dependent aminotransferase n=1 Tax=Erythrobacter litoralis TaxID=39960 RepID=UPI0024357609|nr:histidinol-phosphate transaminase [Erythrobacter litoralis]MDG6079302.1 aminotransferase class I/II-fold pyridoxal phosphate-dependent enzyme [Erythrobacter litoralis]